MVIVYDPRDPTQDREDPNTWKESTNAVLIAVSIGMGLWTRTDAAYWDNVARMADFVDERAAARPA